MSPDIRLAIAKYAIYKADKRAVQLIEKWRKIERQLSIVAGLFNDSRDIEAELAKSGGMADDYVEHLLATKKLSDLWTGYCGELMSQTEIGGRLVRFFFVEASRVWNAELQAFLGRMPSMIERGEFWIPPMLLFQFRRTMSFYRVKILEPIVSKIRSKHSHRNGNPLNGGRPSDIGLQELLSQAESAGVSASELAAQLVAHGLDGKPTGGRAMRMRRETKRLATALRRLKSSSARAVPVGTKPRKAT